MLVTMMAVAAGAVAGPPQAAAADQGPARVMLVGDSITHGSTGEYTWRYFLSRHLRATSPGTDLVGPSRSVWVDETTGWPAVYADPDFDADHAATWGDSLSLPRHDRTALMTQFRPDVVVLQLGVNDLSWLGVPPASVRDELVKWVTAAREVAPDTDFVLMQIMWTSNPQAVELNRLLEELPGTLSTSASRVAVARVPEGFVSGTGDNDAVADTYDPLHPDTSGQVKYAATVADALGTLGVGRPYARPLVVPAEGPRARPVVSARTGVDEAELSWTAPPGASNYDVYRRAGSGAWTPYVTKWFATSVPVGGLQACERHQFTVRARRGWTLAAPDMTSRPVTVTAGPVVRGRPAVRLAQRQRRVVASWGAVAGACSYDVQVVTKAPASRRTVRVTGTSHVVKGLRRGSVVVLKARAVGANNTAAFSRAARIRVR